MQLIQQEDDTGEGDDSFHADALSYEETGRILGKSGEKGAGPPGLVTKMLNPDRFHKTKERINK